MPVGVCVCEEEMHRDKATEDGVEMDERKNNRRGMYKKGGGREKPVSNGYFFRRFHKKGNHYIA